MGKLALREASAFKQRKCRLVAAVASILAARNAIELWSRKLKRCLDALESPHAVKRTGNVMHGKLVREPKMAMSFGRLSLGGLT